MPSNVHSNSIYNSQDIEETKFPSTDKCIKKVWDRDIDIERKIDGTKRSFEEIISTNFPH